MLHACCHCNACTEFEDGVCTQCGLELCEDRFVNSVPFEATTATNNYTSKRPHFLKTSKFDNFSRHLKPLKDFTRRLCESLHCRGSVLEGSLCWLEKVFRHAHFKHVHLASKQSICAAVVLLLCRAGGVVVSLRDIHKAASPVVLKAFGSWKCVVGDVFEELGRCGRTYTVMEMAEIKCERFKLRDGCRRRVKELLGLLEKLWVTEGVGVEGVVVVCCYVAWVGEEAQTRYKQSFASFCRLFKVALSSTMQKHHRTITTALTHLHHHLPWVHCDVRKKRQTRDLSFFFQLDDILKFGGVNGDDDDSDSDDDDTDSDDDNTDIGDDDTDMGDDKSDKDDDFSNVIQETQKDVLQDNACAGKSLNGEEEEDEKDDGKDEEEEEDDGEEDDDEEEEDDDGFTPKDEDKRGLSALAEQLFKMRRFGKGGADDDADNDAACLLACSTDLHREQIDEADMDAEELATYLHTPQELDAIQMLPRDIDS